MTVAWGQVSTRVAYGETSATQAAVVAVAGGGRSGPIIVCGSEYTPVAAATRARSSRRSPAHSTQSFFSRHVSWLPVSEREVSSSQQWRSPLMRAANAPAAGAAGARSCHQRCA